ncbi:mono-functional DNA-alkylating methyl methanesulfonate N-term-domain-containing protein [Syncephalastrum racemosum]|uniref:Mono-functional DNA-alkylating methyl methanesulfonate N-term-domain-containing protein n=1 Tax=Syncephalastrum racemosum TaxID=13706 RepID=A0A1X2H8R1_SYNRA|nr:mono-functional DNA-alkylating methyl methanesulfonate N-term-domain-containing protein [Syncephalastrum racemosum]
MTCFKYVVNAQKATATKFALKGPFTAPNDANLILGKGTRIEIYTLTPNGLKPTLEFSIHGIIAALDLYRPADHEKASLFVLTTRHKFCILSYDALAQEIMTEASGEIGPTSPPHVLACQVLGQLDPSCSYFATRVHESMVTILTAGAFCQRALRESTRRPSLKLRENARRKSQQLQQQRADYHQINLALDGNSVVSFVFLRDTTEPTLAVLYDDAAQDRRCLQTFFLRGNQAIHGEMLMDELGSEDNDHLLIALPPPIGGVLLVGEMAIRYLKPGRDPKAIGIKACSIHCYTLMDAHGTRVLLGDQATGTLYMLTLIISGNHQVETLHLIDLGQVSLPTCLAFLDNDVVFVGSDKGDSQLVHIGSTGGNILEIIEEFPNLGPITDFCVVDLDKQGQGQLVTCSGAGRSSSLRIIRNGVGLNELAAIEISGVKMIWALRPSFDSRYDDLLVFSFFNQTRLLHLREHEMSQLPSYSGFELDRRTLVTGNVVQNRVLQVTDHSVRLMECGIQGKLLDEWTATADITVASMNPTQCVLSLGHGQLVVLQIENDHLVQVGQARLDHEVSCIDISPTDTSNLLASQVAAIGTWHDGVRLVALPSLQTLAAEPLAGYAMPRSILMALFEGISYLLVALGDGQFYNFRLDARQGTLSDKKRSFLGKMPIALGKFTSNGTTHVFAASDKPSVIHSRNQKLIYSNVNLKDIRCVSSFNSRSFPDAVALTTKDGLIIGQMEEIQKLHITKIPSLDTPRRILYQESSKTFGVVTTKLSAGPYELASTTTSGFEILEDQSFRVIDRIYFKYFERVLCVTTAAFDNDGNEYYVLGTGVVSDVYETTSRGRLLVYRISPERTLELVDQLETDGMVEEIRAFKGKLLVSITGMLHIYRWDLELSGRGHLAFVTQCSVPTSSQSLAIQDDTIVAGDLACSVSAFRFTDKQELEEMAQDEEHKEITAVESLGNNLYIAAEGNGHLFVFEHDRAENTMEILSQWHYGERIQRFRFGSLGTNPPDPDSRPVAPSLIFCTVNGAIGVMADLSDGLYKLLWQMQNNLVKILPSIGDLSHPEWRNLVIDDYRDKSIHFIDGDVIESFLDLTPQQMQDVVEGRGGGRRLDSTVEDLCKVVEELMSVHS